MPTLVEARCVSADDSVVCDGAATSIKDQREKRSMNYYVGLEVCLKETSVCIGSNPHDF
jgi:hypothetical protein